MQGQYTYLFPYEKIRKGSKIVIYGMGDVGQNYLQQLEMTHYADAVCAVDRAYDTFVKMVIPVYPPEKVKEIYFDYIVLAFKMGNYAEDVRKNLLSWGVPEEKIIFEGARSAITITVQETGAPQKNIDGKLAFENGRLSIALKYGPGLGDAIIKKKLFIELTKMAPEAVIDIYAPRGKKFIPSLYSDQIQLNQVIDDGGVLYASEYKKYDIAMSVYYMIQINHMDYEKLKKINFQFSDQMKNHMERHHDYRLNTYPSTQNWIHFSRCMYKGRNCYFAYNYTDVFNISDSCVRIPMDEKFHRLWEDMTLKEYITINYGNNVTAGSGQEDVSKQWPKEYFEKFVELFKDAYPSTEIVQLGDSNATKIRGCSRYVLGDSLELVKYILQSAIFHLDIEGGLVHLATQLGTKCIVLFGPTPLPFFGYSQNINLVSQNCNSCSYLYDNSYQCARGLEKPECMWSITPEMVMKNVNDFMNCIKNEI